MVDDEFSRLLSTLFKSHPWHGVSPGDGVPDLVRSYIEIVPSSPVKLELDKSTGHLHVDRPQRFSSMCPTLYGFVPQTYCGESVADFCAQSTGRKRIRGDGDPLDICILSDRDFAHGDLLVMARPIGGLRMIDRGQADDKIVAVLDQDVAYGGLTDIDDCPEAIITRIKHYFLSYKSPPGSRSSRVVKIDSVYGRSEAHEVIRRSLKDYVDNFGTAEAKLSRLRQLLVQSVK